MYTVWLKFFLKPHNVFLKLNKWEMNQVLWYILHVGTWRVSEGGRTWMFVIILRYITSFLLSSAKHGIEKNIRNNIHIHIHIPVAPVYVVDVIWNWHSLRRCRRNPEPPCSRSRIAPGGGNKRRVVTASERCLCSENMSRQHRCGKAVSFRTADLTLSLFPPTTVWTMCGLCVRKLLTVWKTSRRPSAFTLSRMLLRAMKVPVRPAPALKQKHENWHKEDPGLPSKGKKKYGCCPAALHNRAADRSSALFFFCLNGKVCKRKGDLCVIAIIITLT